MDAMQEREGRDIVRADVNKLTTENKKLERQRAELLVAFKKQLKVKGRQNMSQRQRPYHAECNGSSGLQRHHLHAYDQPSLHPCTRS
jgi:hypothetical protein